MLPATLAERALGYTTLVLLSWSPCLSRYGMAVVSDSSSGEQQQHPGGRAVVPSSDAGRWAVCGKTLTPPFLAILVGMAAGMTPLGRALVAAKVTGKGALAQAGAAMLRSAIDVIAMLMSGTLAAQTVVLPSSLLQQAKEGTTGGGRGVQSTAIAVGRQQRPHTSPGRGFLAAAARLLLPESLVKARALANASLTRFLLLPAVVFGAMWGLRRARMLPAAVTGNPILLLVLLTESVMPSAQNLIILLQLSEGKQALAPVLARMLLEHYAYSVLPITLGVTVWATWLGVTVS